MSTYTRKRVRTVSEYTAPVTGDTQILITQLDTPSLWRLLDALGLVDKRGKAIAKEIGHRAQFDRDITHHKGLAEQKVKILNSLPVLSLRQIADRASDIPFFWDMAHRARVELADRGHRLYFI